MAILFVADRLELPLPDLSGTGAQSRPVNSAASASARGDIRGYPRVRDGDGLDFGERRVRLFGVDAFELVQRCPLAEKGDFACGRSAADALKKLVGRHEVTCSERDRDQYGRSVAVCVADGRDLGREMVAAGWAMAYRRFSRDYIDAENQARGQRKGAWVSDHPKPAWEFRAEQRKRH